MFGQEQDIVYIGFYTSRAFRHPLGVLEQMYPPRIRGFNSTQSVLMQVNSVTPESGQSASSGREELEIRVCPAT